MSQLCITRLAPGPRFWSETAKQLLAARSAPWPSGLMILPNLKLAPQVGQAIFQEAGRVVCLPPMETLHTALSPYVREHTTESTLARQLSLYEALRSRQWFKEANLWVISQELTSLFDELTLANSILPHSEDAFAQVLSSQYGIPETSSLRFEAHLVYSLWKAESQDQKTFAHQRIQAAAQWSQAAAHPLYVIAEGELTPLELQLYSAYAQRQPVLVFLPDRQVPGEQCRILQAAWPDEQTQQAALKARIEEVKDPEDLRGRIVLAPEDSLEALAQSVVATVKTWLYEGVQSIGLVALDRLLARRVSALLSREDILLDDETGWKFSTTRVATFLDSLFNVLADDAFHLDLIDFIRSPYAFAELDSVSRQKAVYQLERLIQSKYVISGLGVLQHHIETSSEFDAAASIISSLQALQVALGLNRFEGRIKTGIQAQTALEWLNWLDEALDTLGARTCLLEDTAGAQFLAWLQKTKEAVRFSGVKMSFTEWRSWFDIQMEALIFVPEKVLSPVVLTHLPATRLRTFDALIFMGADDAHLSPEISQAVFAHDGVRKELGLSTRFQAQRRLQNDLAWCVETCPRIVLAWQHFEAGEKRLLAASWVMLKTAQEMAHGVDKGLMQTPAWFVPSTPSYLGQMKAAAKLSPALLPQRLSASAYGSLLACPYQYFAYHVLGLREEDSLEEMRTKRDYGNNIHRVLQQFHTRFPLLLEEETSVLESALYQMSLDEFKADIERNYFELGWMLRWEKQIPAYIDWQRSREKMGWRFQAAEVSGCQMINYADRALTLRGRIDRLDIKDDGTQAVLDYKLGDVQALSKRAADIEDSQLAFYALLQGADKVSEVAYVALDKSGEIKTLCAKEPQVLAMAHKQRIEQTMWALSQGAALMAFISKACQFCAVAGMCRQVHADRESSADEQKSNFFKI